MSSSPARLGVHCNTNATHFNARQKISRALLHCVVQQQSSKMSGIIDLPKPRINCSMLSQHINKPVCFVGRVEKVHPTGKTFTVSDGEGKTAAVELNEPLDEELSGMVELIGMVSNKGEIMATTYNILREDKGIPFDLQLYNEALKIVHDFPQHYPFQATVSE